MRDVLGLVSVLLLAAMGCSEATGAGGAGGADGGGGAEGTAQCQADEDCDDDNDCTDDECVDGVCEFTSVPDPTGPDEPGGPPGEGTTCGYYGGTCEQGSCVGTFACTEAGIREAINAGAGPHTFDCDAPNTIVTEAEIVIDNDVALDGEGILTLSGDNDHRVIGVAEGVRAELHAFVITDGAGSSSGAVSNDGTLELVDVVVKDSGCGGKACIAHGIGSRGDLSIWNSLIDEDIRIDYGAATLTNSTLTGLYLFPAAAASLMSCTVETLVAHSGALVRSSIVAGVCQGSPMSDGYNIESPGNTCGFDQSTDQRNVGIDDLNLQPLLDNGGPTPTRAVGEGSVAIDAIPQAECPYADDPFTGATDQRGEPRPETEGGSCDVGAFERQLDDP